MNATSIVSSPALRSPQVRHWLFQHVRVRQQPKMTMRQKRGLPKTSDIRRPGLYRHMEDQIVEAMGGYPLTLPYSGEVVTDPRETDIDHVVPLAEAMESGGVTWPQATWDNFQSDLANLMVAKPVVNRRYKGSKGVGNWLPSHNRIWYVCDVVSIKLAYGLTFDPVEVRKIAEVLFGERGGE